MTVNGISLFGPGGLAAQCFMKVLIVYQLGQTVMGRLAPQLMDLLLLLQELVDEPAGHVDQFGPCPIDNLQILTFAFQGDVKIGEYPKGLVENPSPTWSTFRIRPKPCRWRNDRSAPDAGTGALRRTIP